MSSMLKALWTYRGFILGSVKREFQSKYRNSLLGAVWNVLNPLAMVVVYTVVFSQVMKARLPGVDSTFSYSIYLCAGILTWGLFAEITGRAQNIFIENANLLKKLSFPRLCLPTVVVLNAGLNFVIIFGLFSGFLLITDNFPGWAYLALVPLLLIEIAFAIGLGITLGVLNAFFRDIGQLFGVVLQFWFWLTPIVYPANTLPESTRLLMDFNPMAALMAAYQTILLNGHWPQWRGLWLVALLAVLFSSIGFRLFRKHAGEMVDEL
jgi:lipopolysaccharide transport system permease protein